MSVSVHCGVYTLTKTTTQLECERRKNCTLLRRQNSELNSEIFKLFYDPFEFLFVTQDVFLCRDRLSSYNYILTSEFNSMVKEYT